MSQVCVTSVPNSSEWQALGVLLGACKSLQLQRRAACRRAEASVQLGAFACTGCGVTHPGLHAQLQQHVQHSGSLCCGVLPRTMGCRLAVLQQLPQWCVLPCCVCVCLCRCHKGREGLQAAAGIAKEAVKLV